MNKDKTHLISRYWIGKNKYIAELTTCLAVVTINEKGEIIRMATFGERKEKKV